MPNTTIASAPLSGGMILRIANGLRCDNCSRLVRGSDVEQLEAGHRIICAACHHLLLSYEVRS
ncbi:hypothetical protein [Bradyrhizobium sp. URHD0069]|jgi:DNA-directed RNA polymerase subunit RPC12/RpoP|uniref:hypothetical protein n=1 Tax=Bradyrhizobium sp. URHD0069 TaxID=1380355 RepID=UPI000AB334D7|nr:hypothetical protein [Bradyrhizobium sp. URHD0069]